MAVWEVSQGELWHRVYRFEAETLEEAQQLYMDYVNDEPFAVEPVLLTDPEYVEDIQLDQIWSEVTADE